MASMTIVATECESGHMTNRQCGCVQDGVRSWETQVQRLTEAMEASKDETDEEKVNIATLVPVK